jgi:DNA helicase HerA-like ATPase
MNLSPLAFAESLRIGSVDFVSPDEIKVLLDIETPDSMALNTGSPRAFPRVNGYVLIPSEEGYTAAQIEWITIERSNYPKRKGVQDFGLIDLPYPLRKMKVNPLGRLSFDPSAPENQQFQFARGVESYPTVGDSVLLPTESQLRAIVESGENRHVQIGISPLAANAKVCIDPDRLFGRHLAVLGNTGSGKSCSVAGLIRWSLEAAKRANPKKEPNARFIVLDPNGEYAKAFNGLARVKVFSVDSSDEENRLRVPLWFWNSAEWCAFTQASAKTQRPTLIQALRAVRQGVDIEARTPSHDMRRFLRTVVTILHEERRAGNPWGSFPKDKLFFEKLGKWRQSLTDDATFDSDEKAALNNLRSAIEGLLDDRQVKYPVYTAITFEIDRLVKLAGAAHAAFGGSDSELLPLDADTPRPFTGEQLLRSIEAHGEVLNVSAYVETMLSRIRTLLGDSRMKKICGSNDSSGLSDWLQSLLGGGRENDGAVTVVDLSLVPSEIVHILTAVITRMTLEALQRYRKLNDGETLPTTLVMEEAHTFIKRYHEDGDTQSAASACCEVFEKVAREGRKFGLGLVLSSQRPSELSPTVLSQCNTYLLHRISNDRDQELVHRLVPDNLRGLLRDLPSLPSRNAILLGWASELPILVQMKHLSEEHRPRSDDPTFWKVWSGEIVATVDWKKIADDWQERGSSDSVEPESEAGESSAAVRDPWDEDEGAPF